MTEWRFPKTQMSGRVPTWLAVLSLSNKSARMAGARRRVPFAYPCHQSVEEGVLVDRYPEGASVRYLDEEVVIQSASAFVRQAVETLTAGVSG